MSKNTYIESFILTHIFIIFGVPHFFWWLQVTNCCHFFFKPWREFLPWNAKVGNQETPGVTDKFGFGVQHETGQRLIEFCQENSLRANTLFQQYKRRLYAWTSPGGQYWNLINSLQPKVEKLDTAGKNKARSWLSQIMNSLLPNSDLNWRK